MSFWIMFVVAFVLVLPLTLMMVPPLEEAWRRRREAPRPFSPRKPGSPLLIPSAEETAASIERFRAVMLRFEVAEAKWKALTETASGVILRRR